MEEHVAWTNLVDLYAFAEARGIKELQNATEDACIDKEATTEETPTYLIKNLYEHTSENSPLRKLWVDWVIRYGHHEGAGSWFADEKYERYTKRFLWDLSSTQCEIANGDKSRITSFQHSRAKYHVPTSK